MEKSGLAAAWFSPLLAGMCRKTANRPGSLDYETTHGMYRIRPGLACRAKPARGAASAMSPPARRCSPTPCGSAPFETRRGSHLCGSRCRDVSSPSEGVHAVSAQQCGFGRGVASGPQVSVALPALRPVAPTGSFAAAVADRIAARQHETLAKSKLLRCCA